MQIYETAKAHFEKDKLQKVIPTRNEPFQAATKPANQVPPSPIAQLPNSSISYNLYTTEAAVRKNSSQDKNQDMTDEQVEYLVASKLKSAVSKGMKIENKELMNLSEKELQALIDKSFNNLTKEEYRALAEYIEKKSNNNLKRSKIAYQIEMGIPSPARDQISDLDEDLPKLTPKLKFLEEAMTLQNTRIVFAELQQEEQAALTRRYQDTL